MARFAIALAPDDEGFGYCVCDVDYVGDACEMFVGNRPCGAGQSVLDLEASGIEIIQAQNFVGFVPPPVRFGRFDSAAYFARYAPATYTSSTAWQHYVGVGFNEGKDAFVESGASGVFDSFAYYQSLDATTRALYTPATVFQHYASGGYARGDTIYVF